MTEKIVIPVAGLGTRLLSATKEQPKEMLPVFAQDRHGILSVRPLVQLVFEQLFDFGFRKFFFVVGRGKRAIEDHFTSDQGFLRRLSNRAKNSQAAELEFFYDKVQASTIVWVHQPAPKEFGHAVLRVESLLGAEPFLVHAGDTYIMSRIPTVLERLVTKHVKGSADATLTLQEVSDPRQYGVAEVDEAEKDDLRVKSVTEKPAKPRSNLAIMPLYTFSSVIFEALRVTLPDRGGEIQLTDAIHKLIETGHEVRAIKLREEDMRLDIGTPENYWHAVSLSYRRASAKNSHHIECGND